MHNHGMILHTYICSFSYSNKCYKILPAHKEYKHAYDEYRMPS